jgi:hypothetical protein
MKKYKLIKEYPASPKLGFIVFERHCGMYHNIETGNMYGSQMIESQPEYWEEVIEKDYEIISYVAKDNPTNITTKIRVAHLNEYYWKIHSVKRLSDGEVFTVGDSVKVYEYSYIKNITGIIINSNPLVKEGIWLRYDSGSSHLSHATKVKQPIFLTHDGKDIFAGDKVWWVNKKTFCSDYFVPTPSVTFFSDLNAYFLTEEEAEDYVYRTKVLFTTEDGVGIKRGDTFYFVDTDLSIGLSNTKYEKCDGRKYFSTIETAQYYMIVNAKVLSIEEFWTFVSKPGSNVVKQKALKRLVKERLGIK